MKELPSFGVRLARFMEHRDLHADAIDGVAETELQAVIEGSTPSMAMLQQLAPALGLHVPESRLPALQPVIGSPIKEIGSFL